MTAVPSPGVPSADVASRDVPSATAAPSSPAGGAPAATGTGSAQAGRGWRKRGAQRSGGGAALLARGEPLVWLTGGALGTCLLMIVGLVTLIVIEGAATFWPQPVVRIDRRDAGPVEGEVVRDEPYDLNRQMLGDLPPRARAEAERLLGTEERIVSRRRLVRTGNFDLTETHFTWVPEIEEAPDGESRPEWALVLERVEWGRFYGEPVALTVRHPRPVSGDEEQLASIREFFERNGNRLSDDERRKIAPALADLDARLQALRIRGSEEFRARFAGTPTGAGKGVAYGTAGADGAFVPLSESSRDLPIAEVLETYAAPATAWERFEIVHAEARARFSRARGIQKDEIGAVNRTLEEARLAVREAEHLLKVPILSSAEGLATLRNELSALQEERTIQRERVAAIAARFGDESPLAAAARAIALQLVADIDAAAVAPKERLDALESELADRHPEAYAAAVAYVGAQRTADAESSELRQEILEIERTNDLAALRLRTVTGAEKEIAPADIVRAYPANRLSAGDRLGIYASRWGEFLADDPREANSEGGVFPAIWGTVVMTLVMSFAVVPFGVLAALYLREYAKGGVVVSMIRIAVNNLAGVPSIVFGVFGLGFFCYGVGGYLDGGPRGAGIDPVDAETWFARLVGTGVLAAAAIACSVLGSRPPRESGPDRRSLFGRLGLALWLATSVMILWQLATTPYFEGLFAAKLPDPTYGKGAILWSSLTLALLTLPVVIVATEEALAAVPKSMREGSYACGAGQWQTIRRIVLPRAMPGIMTGMILAMARGAGEVAPLMLVGAAKLAPELPVDHVFPFVHPDRSFMHLGFHVFDLAMQSPNSEAAKPLVYSTTLLLISIVAALNLSAIWLRTRLRRRFHANQF